MICLDKRYPPGGVSPIYIYTYIYMHAVVLLSGHSLGVLNVIIWSKFAFYKTQIVKKNTIKIGVSALFFKKKTLRATILNVIIWS